MHYTRPTHQFAVYDGVVTRIAGEWARCAADLAARGALFARPADVLAGSTRSSAWSPDDGACPM
jgi:hypothetical protein